MLKDLLSKTRAWQVHKRLFGPETFSGLSRNGSQVRQGGVFIDSADMHSFQCWQRLWWAYGWILSIQMARNTWLGTTSNSPLLTRCRKIWLQKVERYAEFYSGSFLQLHVETRSEITVKVVLWSIHFFLQILKVCFLNNCLANVWALIFI